MQSTLTRRRVGNQEPIGLREALTRFERWRLQDAHFSPQTWAGEKAGLLQFVDFMIRQDATTPAEVTDELVSAWWQSLTVSDTTRSTRLSQLRAFLGYCLKRGWASGDPSALLRAPRVASVPRERLDAAELLALPERAPNPRDRALLSLATNLAVRGGEISRMKVRDVNLDRGEILVRIDKTAETDLMPITQELDVELRRWLRLYMISTPGVGRDSYLIPAVHYEPTFQRYTYYPDRPIRRPFEVVQRALVAMGWESVKQEGVHTVRRSVARVYFDDVDSTDGFDSALLATMGLLHHERSDTTLTYIGRDRQKMARDKHLQGRPFLSRLAGRVTPLRRVR